MNDFVACLIIGIMGIGVVLLNLLIYTLKWAIPAVIVFYVGKWVGVWG